MSCSLSAASFVVAGPSSVPTRLLRQAAGIRMMQKCLPFLVHILEQHRNTPYSPVIQAFLERETDRFDALASSPIFRAWFGAVEREPDWERLTPNREALLKEFCSLALRPNEPQDYLMNVALALAPRGRYAPPELDWCWMAENPKLETVMPISLARVAEVAASLEPGDAAALTTHGCAGTVYKSARLDGETWISNLHPRLKVYLSGTNQRQSGVVPDAVDWQNYPDAWDSMLYRAPYWLMAAVWAEEYADHLELVRVIVPINLPARYQDRSRSLAFTVSSHQGAIFITASDPRRMLEMLLHEKAHVKQRYVDEVWPLLEPEQTTQRFAVPWRPDLRPIFGIFEGAYVFLQVAIGLSRCHLAGRYDVKKRALEMFEYVKVGLDIIGCHARMTPDGQAFCEAISRAFNAARRDFPPHTPDSRPDEAYQQARS